MLLEPDYRPTILYIHRLIVKELEINFGFGCAKQSTKTLYILNAEVVLMTVWGQYTVTDHLSIQNIPGFCGSLDVQIHFFQICS